MTIKNNKKNNFMFRTKFEKLLNQENRRNITAVFEKFCRFDPRTAHDFLWRLTYDLDIAYSALEEIGVESGNFLFERIPVLRNELRFQYEKINHEFFTVAVYEDCKESFENLEDHTDPIVAKVVYEHCMKWCSIKESCMDRILYLLKSDKENNYFGGIRSLGFNMDEANYLKEFHLYIYHILRDLYEHSEQERKRLLEEQEEQEKHYLPYYMEYRDEDETSRPQQEEQENEEQEEQEDEELDYMNSEFELLTPEIILKHKEIFKAFVSSNDRNILVEIAKLGLDLNQVIDKEQEIKEFLGAIDALLA